MDNRLICRAHDFSSNHREELMESRICGCFYCLSIFEPSTINDWVDWPPNTPEEDELEKGTTALCPKCGIDSVIGDKSGYLIEKKFLDAMKCHWFDKSK